VRRAVVVACGVLGLALAQAPGAGAVPACPISYGSADDRRDDAIDIASGRSKDANKDGVPDEAQRKRRRG
jgi:hypothetical protein